MRQVRARVGIVFQSLQPVPASHGARQRHGSADDGQEADAREGGGGRAPLSGSGRPLGQGACSFRPSSRAASSSAWPSRARWRWSPRWCCSTSRPPRSIRSWCKEVGTLLRSLDDLRKTLVVVSHDMDFARPFRIRSSTSKAAGPSSRARWRGLRQPATTGDARVHGVLSGAAHERHEPCGRRSLARRRSRSRRTPASAQSALARVRASGELRIGTDATYPPFASAQGGEFSGFDIDLGRALARAARRQAGVRQRQLRRHLSGAAERQLRHRAVGRDDHARSGARCCCFRIPTSTPASCWPCGKDQQGISGPGGSGRQARRRADQHDRRSSIWKSAPASIVAKYNTIDLALLDLQNGRIDAVVSDAPVLRYMTTLSFHGPEDRRRSVHGREAGHRAGAGQRRSAGGR